VSLDLTLLGTDERPVRWVSIGVEEHHRLLSLAGTLSLPLMERLRDYYDDATIEADELPGFLKEIDHIQIMLASDDTLVPLLGDLNALVEDAVQLDRPLQALAD
jgi:hypothetical protein